MIFKKRTYYKRWVNTWKNPRLFYHSGGVGLELEVQFRPLI